MEISYCLGMKLTRYYKVVMFVKSLFQKKRFRPALARQLISKAIASGKS